MLQQGAERRLCSAEAAKSNTEVAEKIGFQSKTEIALIRFDQVNC
jgi:hypothetical protein